MLDIRAVLWLENYLQVMKPNMLLNVWNKLSITRPTHASSDALFGRSMCTFTQHIHLLVATVGGWDSEKYPRLSLNRYIVNL